MKHSYHTDIAIQYRLGILDPQIKAKIPSSTLHNWDKKDFSLLFGSDYVADYEQNLELIREFVSRKSLLKIAKSVYDVYSAYVKIFDLVKNKKLVFRQSSRLIIDTIDRIKDTTGFKKALNAFDNTYQQYYAWKKKVVCKTAPKNLCRKLHYKQLTFQDIDTIRTYLSKPQYRHWSITSVYYQILRDKAAFFSKTSFYKYVNQLNMHRSRPEKKKYTVGIRADGPKRILHMDVTIYKPLDNSKLYLYFLVDNYSRFILNWKSSLQYSAAITFENISEAYSQFNLSKINPGIDLLCDGGSENKGPVDTFVSAPENNIKKLVAQSDIRFSNSMVEAVNKRMKYDFLFTTKLFNNKHVMSYLMTAVKQYNSKPHSALYGLTPEEVFNGALPDKDRYKPALELAAKKRKEINLNQNCLNCFDTNTLSPHPS